MLRKGLHHRQQLQSEAKLSFCQIRVEYLLMKSRQELKYLLRIESGMIFLPDKKVALLLLSCQST